MCHKFKYKNVFTDNFLQAFLIETIKQVKNYYKYHNPFPFSLIEGKYEIFPIPFPCIHIHFTIYVLIANIILN